MIVIDVDGDDEAVELAKNIIKNENLQYNVLVWSADSQMKIDAAVILAASHGINIGEPLFFRRVKDEGKGNEAQERAV